MQVPGKKFASQSYYAHLFNYMVTVVTLLVGIKQLLYIFCANVILYDLSIYVNG